MRKRQMPRTFIPRPGLEGDRDPGAEGLFLQEELLLALELDPGPAGLGLSTVTVRGRRISAGFLSSEFSGPERDVRMTGPSPADQDGDARPRACGPCPASSVKKANVPWLPFRSGAHMPESRWPLNFSGGKVMGTLRIVRRMPFSPRIFQNGHALPQAADLGLGERDEVLAQGERPLGPADPGRGQVGEIGPRIAAEEVEDVVLGGLRARS